MRRVAAIALPDLPLELARGDDLDPSRALVGVVVREAPEEPGPSDVLEVVSEPARRCGARAGQTVAEAAAVASALVVRRVAPSALREALGRVAEVALALGPRAAIGLDAAAITLDTVWLDLTGAAHLVGGEASAAASLATRVSALGHHARVAIASGPRVARAVALFGASRAVVVPERGEADAMAPLPTAALPIAGDDVTWLARLGVLTVGDFARLPRSEAISRLRDAAPAVLALASGHDDAPLAPYEPPAVAVEQASWDAPIASIEPLLFASRGMVARLAARLEGRGEAALAIGVEVGLDRGIAALRGVEPTSLRCAIELPAPLSHEPELARAIRSRLETLALAAPARSLSIAIERATRARATQLDLGRDVGVSPDALALLLSELSNEIGEGAVGVLEARAAHRPEARTRLVPALRHPHTLPLTLPVASSSTQPTRLLPAPLRLDLPAMPRPGDTLVLGGLPYVVERLRHHLRLDGVEWWTGAPTSRDYARAWLGGSEGGSAAWIYVDRLSGEVFLHGLFD